MSTDLDRLASGSAQEDFAKKAETGTVRDRAAEMSEDDKIPVKAMPMKDTAKPYTLKGG